MSKLRIAMLAHPGLGGSGTVAAELASELARRHHEVHIVGAGRHPRLADNAPFQLHQVDASTHPMWEAAPSVLALASEVAALSRKTAIDIVHTHFGIPYGVAGLLARGILDGPAPWVATFHGTDITQLADEHHYRSWIEAVATRSCITTVPSKYLAGEVSRRFPKCNPRVIYNFVADEYFRRELPERRFSAEHPLVIVHASNFRPVKRPLDVAETFIGLPPQLPARLLLIGDGPCREQVLERLRQAGVADRVSAPGAVKRFSEAIAVGHVALLPSEQESFGMFALEAMASGMPVVASRVGGLPEVVEHGETGWLETVGDSAGMAQRIVDFAGDELAWKKMAVAARTRAKNFALAKAVDQYENCYRSAIAGPESE